jgi:hypothetical protein
LGIDQQCGGASQPSPFDESQLEGVAEILACQPQPQTITSIWNIECVPRALRSRFYVWLTSLCPPLSPKAAQGDSARVLALFFGCKRTIFNFSGSDVNDEFGELSRVAGPFRMLRHTATMASTPAESKAGSSPANFKPTHYQQMS